MVINSCHSSAFLRNVRELVESLILSFVQYLFKGFCRIDDRIIPLFENDVASGGYFIDCFNVSDPNKRDAIVGFDEGIMP